MSEFINMIDNSDRPVPYPLSHDFDGSSTCKHITKIATKTLQTRESDYRPLRRPPRTATSTSDRKILPIYQSTLKETKPPALFTSQSPLPSHNIKTDYKSKRTPSEHERKTKKPPSIPPKKSPQSSFQTAYLFFVGACALIKALLYGLLSIFSNQSAPVANRKQFEDKDIRPLINPRNQNDGWEEIDPKFLARSKRAALLHEKETRKRENRELQATIKSLPNCIPDKNIYGSRFLDSIKTRVLMFENPKEPPVPLSEEAALQIDTLKKSPYNIHRWRPIAGDGNCYYRANMFGLIEQIITKGNRQRFNDLADTFETITLQAPQSSHKHFIASLRAAALGSKWETLDSFKHDVVDSKTGLDKAMVCAARYLVASEVEKMAGQELDEHGIKIEYLIEGPLENYCTRIRTVGEYAEGPLVNMSLLPKALGFSLTLHTVAGSEGLFTIEHTGESGTESVSMLLIPERAHYVLAYPKTNKP